MKFRTIIIVSAILCAAIFIGVVYKKSEHGSQLTIGIAQWVKNEQFSNSVKGFKEGLNKLGYIDGDNIRYIHEYSNADVDKHKDIIADFVRNKVDLIFTQTTFGTRAAKEVTTEIPIVFTIVTYPVEANVIDTLMASGNNLVGTRNYISPARQYYFFEQLYSQTKTLGFVHRKGEPNSEIQYNEFREMLSKRNISVIDIAAADLSDLHQQLKTNRDKIDSLYSACDTLIQNGGEEIVIEFCKTFKKPNFTCNTSGVMNGALIGNVAEWSTIAGMAAEKAALILNGTKPSHILTESPREDHVILNQQTAKEIGIDIPDSIVKHDTLIIN